MKVYITPVIFLLTATLCHGQDSVRFNSAEARARVEKQLDDLRQWEEELKRAAVLDFEVGCRPRVSEMDAKVLQVIDDKRMLVGLRHSESPKREGYKVKVIVYCPSARIADGKEYLRGSLKDATGYPDFKVTTTESYVDVSGARRTVFVMEHDLDAQKERDEAAATAKKYQERYRESVEKVNKEQKERKEAVQKAKEDDLREAYLRYARKLVDREDYAKARVRLQEIIDKYPDTKEATEAKSLLAKLPKE
jgi:hypothetical protein